MSDVLMLYLFTRLDTVVTLLWVLVFFGGTCLLVLCVGYVLEMLPPDFKLGTKALSAWIAAIVLAVATPSSSDLAIIVGGKVAIDAARSPEAHEISGLILDVVRAKLQEAKQ